MAKISPLMIAPPLIFLGLAMLFFFGLNRDNPDTLPSAFVGKPAPALALEVFADAELPVDLADGQMKLVNFWASWCAPCRAEHPNLTELAQAVPVIGINYKDNAVNAQAFLDELGNPYAQMGRDPNGKVALNWGVYGVPETYVIDGQGRVLLRIAGPVTQRVIEAQIRPLLP